MQHVNNYLKNKVNNGIIPGFSSAITYKQNIRTLLSYGRYTTNKDQYINISENTLFDLASLTKVVCTLPAVLLLRQEDEIDLDDSIHSYLPFLKNKNITIRQALQHTTGLVADLPRLSRFDDIDIISEISQFDVVGTPGNKVVYSDLGMILLGKLIEVVTNQTLDDFSQEYLFTPWQMTNTIFNPDLKDITLIAATEKLEHGYVHGEVHDEKAWLLNGVSGSAGLFSNVYDINKYCSYWLYPEKQTVLKPETMALAFSEVIQNRGLGFEVYKDKSSVLSCSEKWSLGTFGHTGFTGTSIWIDPYEEITSVLLTNIVHYGRNHSLQQIRKEYHSLIYQELIENK